MTLDVGYTQDSQAAAMDLFMRAAAASADQLHGVGIATFQRIHVYVPERAEIANRSLSGADTGGFEAAICSIREIETIDTDLLVGEVGKGGADTYEVGIAGFARRFCLAGDSEEVSWAVEAHMEFGGFNRAYQATDWLADWTEVQPRMILHSLEELEQRIERAEARDEGYVQNPSADMRVADALKNAAYFAGEAGEDTLADRLWSMRSKYRSESEEVSSAND